MTADSTYSFGLYGSGIHEFVLREIEVGSLAAMAEDDEACGVGPLFDLMYEKYIPTEKLGGGSMENHEWG